MIHPRSYSAQVQMWRPTARPMLRTLVVQKQGVLGHGPRPARAYRVIGMRFIQSSYSLHQLIAELPQGVRMHES